MSRKVTLVELSLYERIVPLVSGYLQAYACQDPFTRKSYEFEKCSWTLRSARDEILGHLLASDSDVYAFSCYLWNTRLVTSLLPPLLEARPDAQVMLGGPQVIYHAEKYLDPGHENLVLCNGEGEKTFSDFLKETTEEKPDFSRVRGLSFYRDQELITTENQERIRELDEIPSPFLGGLFDGEYSISILETNRGCPFRCGFCFWGAATNDKMARFDEERIREEVTYLSKQEVMFLYIADSNWGMLKRDVDLTRHMADCTEKFRAPTMIYFSASKNKPDRVTEIIGVLKAAGVAISQPISLQTLNETSLRYIDRANIKPEAYAELQKNLNELNIDSFTELIWPLPGETLSSFKQGIATLCGTGVSTVVVYPHLLLHNTPIYKKREDYALVTREVGGEAGEDEVIVSTAEVSESEFKDGMRFFYATHLLYNSRALFNLSGYLDRTEARSRGELFADFVEYCKGTRSRLTEFWEDSIESGEYSGLFNYGTAVHISLHSHRDECDELVYRFASSQDWWDDPNARFLFEVDTLAKPYVYNNTPLPRQINEKFEHLEIREITRRSYDVEIPEELSPLLGDLLRPGVAEGANGGFRINHERKQYPFVEAQGIEHNAGYCHGMILRIDDILPAWSRLGADRP